MALTEVQKQRRRLRLFSWTGAALVAAILVTLNFIASYVPFRLDTSQGRVYSISTGTKALLKKLDDTLLVRIMFTSQLPPQYKLNEQYLHDLLTEYKRASKGKIRIEFFDPASSPRGREEAMAHGVVPVQLDVRERDRREVKECFMGVAFLYGDKKGSIPIVQDSQNLEYEITVQIKKLIDPEKPMIGIASNGGAMDFSNKSVQPLAQAVNQLYTVQTVDLTQPVPAALKAVWMIAPTTVVEPLVLENLRAYLKSGGTVGLLLDSREVVVTEFRTSPITNGLGPLLNDAGLEMKDGLVVDPRCDRIQVRAVQGAFQMINIVDYPLIPVIINIDRSHPATKGIEAFTMPYVSPIEFTNKKPKLTYTALAKSSEMSYVDTMPFNVNPIYERHRPPNVPDGPFNLAMLVEGRFESDSAPDAGTADGAPANANPGRLVLFGSSRFIRSEFPIKQSNYSLFMNMLDWSVQDEILLQIRSKGMVQKPLRRLSDGMRLLFKTLFMVTLPVAALLAGFLVWRRQKVRRALLPLEYREV